MAARMTASTPQPLLDVSDLRIESSRRGEPARPLLEGLSFAVAEKEFVALVGESGSGKTLAARAILDLLPPGVRRACGSITLAGRDLTTLDARALRKVRGAEAGMVFQEPMVSLNPALTVGRQTGGEHRIGNFFDAQFAQRRQIMRHKQPNKHGQTAED